MDCCTEDMNNFKVTIFNDDVEVWSYEHSGRSSYESIIFVPNIFDETWILGNKAKILLLNWKDLHLAEVQVFTKDYAPPLTNMALMRPTSNTSSGPISTSQSSNVVDSSDV